MRPHELVYADPVKYRHLMEPSPILADGGQLVGRDPRVLAPEDFDVAGVDLHPVMKAIRAKCIDCCGYDVSEVRKCTAINCPLWPLRMGNFPSRLRAAANAKAPAPEENVALDPS